jgi:multidrug efflux pump subunit AcrA (membrane-fusion protein)
LEEQDLDMSTVEIRSVEVQEILGKSPPWMIRAGVSVILGVVIVLLVGSYFFKYPDIISSKITLTTENPPFIIKANATGKITALFFKEHEEVQANAVIAVIENTASYKDVKSLKIMLKTPNIFELKKTHFNLALGELQQPYSSFIRLLKEYQGFKELDYYAEKIKSINRQKHDYDLYYIGLCAQRDLQEKELKLAELQFNRDSELYEKGVHAKAEFEQAEKLYLQQKSLYENARTTIASTQIQMNQLDQQILDLKLQETQELSKKEIAMQETFENLKSQLKKWEQTYLISATISGKVTYNKVWSKNQNVVTGDIVATVVPNEEINLIGKLAIPVSGMGKVKEGQTVNIKFDNFPHMEFGMLKGNIKDISLMPTTTGQIVEYAAAVTLPKKLISNYGKELKFSQEMTGTAEIITDDIRLLERFFSPLKSIWRQNE